MVMTEGVTIYQAHIEMESSQGRVAKPRSVRLRRCSPLFALLFCTSPVVSTEGTEKEWTW